MLASDPCSCWTPRTWLCAIPLWPRTHGSPDLNILAMAISNDGATIATVRETITFTSRAGYLLMTG